MIIGNGCACQTAGVASRDTSIWLMFMLRDLTLTCTSLMCIKLLRMGIAKEDALSKRLSTV